MIFRFDIPAPKFSPPGLISRAVGFARSVTSGRASDETIAVRRRECEACPELVREADELYCGACRCPRTRWSELSRKLEFAYLRCPLGRPGFDQ